MYSTFNRYAQNGGKLDGATYNRLAKQAFAEINYRTFNRAIKYKDEMSENLCECECALIDVLNSFSSLPAGVTSASNDGVSVSYSQDNKIEEQAKKEEIFNRYLTYPVNLLYGGVLPCDFE